MTYTVSSGMLNPAIPYLYHTPSTEADVQPERRRFTQTMASEMANCFCCLSQNAMVCLAHCHQELQQKSWKLQDFFFKPETKTKTKTSWSKTKTKTFIFVLEAPRDHDPVLEDYITASLTFHSHHRPISHRFRDIGHFRRKSPIFPTPCVLSDPMKGFPLEFGISVRGRICLSDGATRWSKRF